MRSTMIHLPLVTFCLLGSVFSTVTSSPVLDTKHWLCSAKVNLSEMQLHFFKVNHQQTGAPIEPLTLMVLNVTNWQSFNYKWCLFQVRLTGAGKSPLSWSCQSNSVLDLTEPLGSNIASVLNITKRVIAEMKASNSLSVQRVRKLIACPDNATETTSISPSKNQKIGDWVRSASTTGIPVDGTVTLLLRAQMGNLTSEKTDSLANASALARVRRHGSTPFPGKHSRTSTSNHCDVDSTSGTCLRNIKKPLIWIIVVIVLVIGSLLGYVYIFDGPRVGREPNNPKAKLDVSVAASFGNVQNNLKKASINDAAGEDLTVTSSTETNLVAQQKGLNVTSNSGGKHELNAGEFKGPDNPQANARLEMDSNVPLTGISEQANGVSH